MQFSKRNVMYVVIMHKKISDYLDCNSIVILHISCLLDAGKGLSYFGYTVFSNDAVDQNIFVEWRIFIFSLSTE